MKNNCLHEPLGQILGKGYKETKKPNWHEEQKHAPAPNTT